MKFYGLKSCDTCRKARKALASAGHDVTYIDVREDGVPAADLARFLDAFGEALVNRKSTTWRGLSQAEKQQSPLDLLDANPTLMKRPVIDAGQLYLGWTKETELALI